MRETRRKTMYRVPADHESAAALLRTLLRAGVPTDKDYLVQLATRAYQTAPNRALRASMRKYRNAVVAGRTIKWSTFPARFIEPIDPALVAAVEEAFTEGEHHE